MTASRGQHLIGKMLGSCVLEKLLGYGGSSAVFLAQQQNPTRKVAVKVFLPRASMDIRMQRDFYRRFLREAEAVSKLEHANILPIYSYGEQDGLPYIVMPYMPGGTLAEYMSRRGPLSLQEARWYLEQLAAALDFAHQHGCVHCDVKPANILLDSDGHVILSDFGIARVTRPASDPADATDVKHSEALLGTPDYISPEQALGHHLDGRSDIYSLGVTLFFVLSKRLPFRADSTIALALLHVHEPPPSLALIRADITPLLDRVVRKALAKDPDDRFQTAQELSRAFAAAVEVGESRSTTTHPPELAFLDDEKYLASPAAQPLPPTPRPIVRVKPTWVREWSSTRIKRGILILMALMIIIATTGFSIKLMNGTTSRNHSAPTNIAARTTVTPTPPPMPTSPFALPGNWPQGTNAFFDQQHRYHIINTQAENAMPAPFQDYQVQDFKLSVKMLEATSKKGSPDFHGVIFRVAPDQSFFYLFEVSPRDNQECVFSRFSSSDPQAWYTIKNRRSAALKSGIGESNTITVEARGNTFFFSINGVPWLDQPLADPSTRGVKPGQIGVYVENQGEEVIFSELTVGTLK
ncbi:serine/threonine protein kinase [Dictyobacter aurantiacus]|uniref:non-specific serine/threonine protein kinase n=1 Tax=Dictyobacter aurantiacus TaxID=1936993 RepID=A0A401ZHI0_9CHLR|nr:serine/threonine-protein kinase [Dictyobacter aurantiacus]GCE06327.1 hypothetical protein KDAU_36560 [Dictyobacter aurantiacus]